jgi:hypothetical protein
MPPYVEAEEARRLFGHDCFGPEAFAVFLGVDDLFGPALASEQIRESLRVPFSSDELKRAKSLEMILVYRLSHDKYGNGLTIRYLREACMRRKVFGQGRERPWYASERFARDEVPNPGWSLVRKKEIPGSLDRIWKDQSEILRQWTEENGIQPEMIRRRTAVEAVYDALLYYGQNRQAEVQLVYDWTATRSSDDSPVFVACYESRIWIDALSAAAREPCIGVYPALLGHESRGD